MVLPNLSALVSTYWGRGQGGTFILFHSGRGLPGLGPAASPPGSSDVTRLAVIWPTRNSRKNAPRPASRACPGRAPHAGSHHRIRSRQNTHIAPCGTAPPLRTTLRTVRVDGPRHRFYRLPSPIITAHQVTDNRSSLHVIDTYVPLSPFYALNATDYKLAPPAKPAG